MVPIIQCRPRRSDRRQLKDSNNMAQAPRCPLYIPEPSRFARGRGHLENLRPYRKMVHIMARRRDYPIIRFVIGAFYVLALVCLLGGLSSAAYLWIRAESLREGIILGGPLSNALNVYDSGDLCLGAAVVAASSLVAFLLLGAFAQILAMQRDRAIAACLQVQLLEDILEQNEEAAISAQGTRVELCEGCGRLGSLHRIDSGQWVCRDCRHQLRSA